MANKNYPGKGKVAVLRTRPETVLDDYKRLMELAGYQEALPKDKDTILKINISWQTWYPACSTTPWQLEGVIRTLQEAGYDSLMAAHNRTVVVDAYVGERNNKHKYVVEKYGVRNVHLYEPQVEWVVYEPKAPMLVLDRIYPEGIKIPKMFIGRNIIQLPTVKTHVFTVITGAMKNAFGGLLSENRHWTHAVIDETVVDLLTIQQEIHPGLFAVMDGTFAGDGPGPRAMRWHEKDVILASADQVAIDAISAKLQGFDPMSLKFIRLAHELGLGVGDPRDIEVVGDVDVMNENWHFVQEETFASRGQKMIYHGPLKPFEHLLLRSPLVPWSYFASNFYHNVYWYPFVGRKRVIAALDTKWGRLFESYGADAGLEGAVLPGIERKTVATGLLGLAGVLSVIGAGLWLWKRNRR
ncbi:MAG: DUF362 domain-containing protein [Chloroflexi bacterium]|nr:DUF362 domain-containing protein [Anaerolineae bacterium]RLC70336.1 MAG: DUF362 domain-containing protein [Chloroflexota bacterium]